MAKHGNYIDEFDKLVEGINLDDVLILDGYKSTQGIHFMHNTLTS